MKSSEFIRESVTLAQDAADAMPATYVLPDLKSQDSYEQYRFGVTLASARAHSLGEIDIDTENAFGEKMVIVAQTDEEVEQMKMALKLFGKNNTSVLVSTAKSIEQPEVNKKSPCAPQYSKKLRKD